MPGRKAKIESPAEADVKRSDDAKAVAEAIGALKAALSKVTGKTSKENLEEALVWLED